MVNPALRAEMRRLGRAKSTPEYAMLRFGESLPQPQPHPTHIDPADHLPDRDPQLPSSLFHARRAGSKPGSYNKFTDEEKAIVILRWLDYRIKNTKPIQLVMAALKVGHAPSWCPSMTMLRCVICAPTCEQDAIDDHDDVHFSLKGMPR
eukprot:55821-Eustigmatos_ZCMA.PRE.2